MHNPTPEKQKEIERNHLANIFNEWARLYSKDPEAWGKILGENGEANPDYGQRCASLFIELSNKLKA